MNNNIMLDLETLGNGRNSVILSIGAVRFDPEVAVDKQKFDDTFYAEFGAESQLLQQRMGMQINPLTVEWWMRQNVLAKRVFKAGIVNDPVDTLAQFSDFVRKTPETCIWGNGADFDNMILGELYDAFSLVRPWSYGQNRCYRTMKNLPIAPPNLFNGEGVPHNALDDAVRQAKHLTEIYRCLRNTQN